MDADILGEHLRGMRRQDNPIGRFIDPTMTKLALLSLDTPDDISQYEEA